MKQRKLTTAEHIAIINGEMGVVKTDIRWMKRFIWVNLVAWLGILTMLILK